VVLRTTGVLAIASLAACTGGGGGDTTIDNKHDACAPLALVSTTASDKQLEAMEAGQALWREYGAPGLGLRADTTLEVRFEKAAPAFYGLYDDERRLIFINTSLASPEQMAIVIAHEVGHAFGLEHVSADERISVMNPANLSTPPNAEDQAALGALWGTCE
jgi:hypothetical protein